MRVLRLKICVRVCVLATSEIYELVRNARLAARIHGNVIVPFCCGSVLPTYNNSVCKRIYLQRCRSYSKHEKV